MAGLLLKSANQSKFGELKTNLANKYTQGDAAYPEITDSCVCLLKTFLPTYRTSTNGKANGVDDVASMENGQRGWPNKNTKGKYKQSKAEHKATQAKVVVKEAKDKVNAEATQAEAAAAQAKYWPSGYAMIVVRRCISSMITPTSQMIVQTTALT